TKAMMPPISATGASISHHCAAPAIPTPAPTATSKLTPKTTQIPRAEGSPAMSRRRQRARHAQVGAHALAAAFAAQARPAIAAERRRGVEAVERVVPAHAGAQPLREPQDPRALVGPDAGAEAVAGVVRLLDRLLGRTERQHREYRPEDLLA